MDVNPDEPLGVPQCQSMSLISGRPKRRLRVCRCSCHLKIRMMRWFEVALKIYSTISRHLCSSKASIAKTRRGSQGCLCAGCHLQLFATAAKLVLKLAIFSAGACCVMSPVQGKMEQRPGQPFNRSITGRQIERWPNHQHRARLCVLYAARPSRTSFCSEVINV